jgi:hypothetical protein
VFDLDAMSGTEAHLEIVSLSLHRKSKIKEQRGIHSDLEATGTAIVPAGMQLVRCGLIP